MLRKEKPGRKLESQKKHTRRRKKEKFQGNCEVANFIFHCCGVQHVIETSFSAFPFEFFFSESMGAISDEYGGRLH